jgi:hypothetical protein
VARRSAEIAVKMPKVDRSRAAMPCRGLGKLPWGRLSAAAAVAGAYVGSEYRAYLDLRADAAVEAHIPAPDDARATQVVRLPRLLTDEEIASVHELYARRAGTEPTRPAASTAHSLPLRSLSPVPRLCPVALGPPALPPPEIRRARVGRAQRGQPGGGVPHRRVGDELPEHRRRLRCRASRAPRQAHRGRHCSR